MKRKRNLPLSLRQLTKNTAFRSALLGAFVVLPAAVYASQVTGLTNFLNGEVADADPVNANFTALATAINDNDNRVAALENLLGTSCPAGQFITAITAGGSLTCAAP